MSNSANSSFLVLAANTPWVYALAQSLASHGAVTTVCFYDWANHRRLKPAWPETKSAVHRVLLNMPRGYAGTLEPIFRPLIRRLVDRERTRLRKITGSEPVVICPYPYLAPWVRHIPGSHLVYYNLDDYPLYDPSRAERTTALEDELVRRAELSLCLSVHQVGALQARHPAAAAKIVHFPLGVVREFLNEEPDRPPLPNTVGYVGNLTNRVDWRFVEHVAALVPEARFHIVGKLDALETGAAVEGWQEARSQVLKLPNVVYEGEVPQEQVREHYWRYAVNWMPYAMEHPFNVASCPTKIMDAIASGRPFLSTDMPEVRLYPDHIHVADTPEHAAVKLRMLLDPAYEHDAGKQVAFATTQTWSQRAEQLIGLLSNVATSVDTNNEWQYRHSLA